MIQRSLTSVAFGNENRDFRINMLLPNLVSEPYFIFHNVDVPFMS